MRVWILLAALGSTIACTGEPEEETGETDTSAGAMTDGGTWRVVFETATTPPPVSEETTATVSVFGGEAHDAPATAVAIEVDVSMPAHGHGTNTTPVVTANGDGTFLVEGLLFHMTGDWEAAIAVSEGATAETATFEVAVD